jgi:hypothetical protein
MIYAKDLGIEKIINFINLANFQRTEMTAMK